MKATVNKVYELEQLILNNGDQQKIDQLRKELGFENKQEEKFEFNRDEYLQLKAKGYSDRKISTILGTTYTTLWKHKNKNGLTSKIVIELIKKYQRENI